MYFWYLTPVSSTFSVSYLEGTWLMWKPVRGQEFKYCHETHNTHTHTQRMVIALSWNLYADLPGINCSFLLKPFMILTILNKVCSSCNYFYILYSAVIFIIDMLQCFFFFQLVLYFSPCSVCSWLPMFLHSMSCYHLIAGFWCEIDWCQSNL